MSVPIGSTERLHLELFDLVLGAVLLAGVLVAFWPSLTGFFISDDFLLIDAARSISAPWSPLTGNWLLEHGRGGWYRPWTLVTWLIDSTLWGLNPVGYHLSNLIVHYIVCLECYGLALLLLRRRWAAALAAGTFAVHPVHAEAVGWLAARTDLWCAVFGIGAMLAFLRLRAHHSKRWAVAVPVLLTLSILSKETGYVFFLVMLALEFLGPWVPLDQKEPDLRLQRIVPSFITVAVLLVIRYLALGGMGGYGAAAHFAFGRVPTYLRTYFQWTIDPFRVAGYDQFRWSLVYAAIALLFFLGVFFRQTRWAVLWIVITLAPALTLCREQYLYIPLFGFGLLLGAALDPEAEDRAITSMHAGVVRGIAIATLAFFYLLSTRAECRLWTHTGDVAQGILKAVVLSHPDLPEGARVDLIAPPKDNRLPIATFQNGWDAAVRLYTNRDDLAGSTFHSLEEWEASLDSTPPPPGSVALEMRQGVIVDCTDEATARFGPVRNRVPMGELVVVSPEAPVHRIDVPETLADRVTIYSSASRAAGLPDGTAVAELRVIAAAGETRSFLVRLGQETAEWALDRLDAGAASRRARPPVALSWLPEVEDSKVFVGQAYRATFVLPAAWIVRTLEVRLADDPAVRQAEATLEIREIYLVAPSVPESP